MASKRRRTSYTVYEKLDVVLRLRSGETQAKISRETNIPESTLRGWIKEENKLRSIVMDDNSGRAFQQKRAKMAKDPALDKAVYEWYLSKKSEGAPLSGPLVQNQALHISKQLHPDDPDDSFLATRGWLFRWMRRHNIRSMKVIGDAGSEDGEAEEDFCPRLQDIKNEEGPVQDHSIQSFKVIGEASFADTEAVEEFLPGLQAIKKEEGLVPEFPDFQSSDPTSSTGCKQFEDRVAFHTSCNMSESLDVKPLAIWCNHRINESPSVKTKCKKCRKIHLPTVTAKMSENKPGICSSTLAKYKANFKADPKNRLAQQVCTKENLIDVMRSREVETQLNHIFTHKVEAEGKPMTNQAGSGRCWIFAALNCARLPFIKAHDLDEFEFSQNYVFFWDKIERMHYFLEAFIDIARKGESAEGRLVQHLLTNPAEDGGQWHMLVNVIEKHGLMPKKCFLEAWTSDNTRRLNLTINTKMREYCMRLRSMVEKGSTEDDLETKVEVMMEEIYRLCSITLGTPPDTFTYEYYTKNKEYKKIGPITPKDFYEQYVKPHYNLQDKVVLVNDPRPSNPYNRLYTVDYLGNMTGGQLVLYINQPADVLKQVASKSIKENEPVWFGCDVGKHCSWRKAGVLDLNIYDYDLVFGINVLKMNKAERLIFKDSLMTHAMVFTAVSEEDGKQTKWRVENSWGADGGDKGYLVMSDDWFTEFVFEVVVDKKFVEQDLLEILKQEPVVLPAWDPMGALAATSKL